MLEGGIYRIQVDRDNKDIINTAIDIKIKEIAFRDFLARCFYNASQNFSKGRRGTGFNGIITINRLRGFAVIQKVGQTK